ncbi:hypothetical protein RBA41_10100 [Massilia sp. CCM 9210]|nr:hypothetical protein [Massilia sp. CCM 9210]MDQ1813656.1 hypothetical protein [Massilia sp. CCM 9210]
MNPIIMAGGENDNYLYGGAAPEAVNGKGGIDVLSGQRHARRRHRHRYHE